MIDGLPTHRNRGRRLGGRHGKRRVLRTLEHFAPQLWLAIRGVAGSLPFVAEDDDTDEVSARLAQEASRFLKDRR